MMIKPAVFATLVLAVSASSMSFAVDPIPVVEVSPGVSLQADVRQLQPGTVLSAGGSQAAETLYQQQLLQQEVQELRGIVEQQAYEIKRMREEQRDRYLDLDRRITLLNQAPTKRTAADVPAEPAPVAIDEQIKTPSTDVVKEPVAIPVDVAPVVENKVSEKEAYQTAFSLVRNKQYAEASKAFEQLIKDYPNGKYTGNAYYWLGEVLLVESKQAQALKAFETLLEQYPNHRKAADAKFKQGKIYLQMGDKTQAKVLLQDVINLHPGTSAAKLAEAEIRDAQL
jgi:tol-pal system protein YbgF